MFNIMLSDIDEDMESRADFIQTVFMFLASKIGIIHQHVPHDAVDTDIRRGALDGNTISTGLTVSIFIIKSLTDMMISAS